MKSRFLLMAVVLGIGVATFAGCRNNPFGMFGGCEDGNCAPMFGNKTGFFSGSSEYGSSPGNYSQSNNNLLPENGSETR